MLNVATIITASHLSYALAMAESLRRFSEVCLHALVVDRKSPFPDKGPSLCFYSLDQLLCTKAETTLASEVIAKYQRMPPNLSENQFASPGDLLRWAMKPFFALHLLRSTSNIWYCDSDLYFCSRPHCLVQAMKKGRFVVSPHYRPIKPDVSHEARLNYLHGLYNAGFFIATYAATDILRWWAERCAEHCVIAPAEGYYVDQRYLDVVPIYFRGVHVLRHRGCNVGGWNITGSPRRRIDGRCYVCGRQPVVFVHFSPWTVLRIKQGYDPCLSPILLDWQQTVDEMRNDFFSD